MLITMCVFNMVCVICSGIATILEERKAIRMMYVICTILWMSVFMLNLLKALGRL